MAEPAERRVEAATEAGLAPGRAGSNRRRRQGVGARRRARRGGASPGEEMGSAARGRMGGWLGLSPPPFFFST